MSTDDIIEGKVAKVLNSTEIVVNKGSQHGVVKGTEYIVYKIGDVIEDPDTGEALGNVEHVKAHVRPKHIQDEMTVMESAETTTKRSGLSIYSTLAAGKTVTKDIADNPDETAERKVRKGDLVRTNMS